MKINFLFLRYMSYYISYRAEVIYPFVQVESPLQYLNWFWIKCKTPRNFTIFIYWMENLSRTIEFLFVHIKLHILQRNFCFFLIQRIFRCSSSFLNIPRHFNAIIQIFCLIMHHIDIWAIFRKVFLYFEQCLWKY